MGNAVPGIPPSTSAPQSLCAVAPTGTRTPKQGQRQEPLPEPEL